MDVRRTRISGLLGHGARGLILTTKDNALWVIESDLQINHLVGEMVIVEGTAVGFDRIRADWVGPAKKTA